MPRNENPSKTIRGPIAAFAIFLKYQREQVRKDPQKTVEKKFSTICSQQWKTLTHEQKKPFMDLAMEDRARYNQEIKNDEEMKNDKKMKKNGVEPLKIVDAKKRVRRRKMKDPNSPKQPCSPFIWYSRHNRNIIKEQNPNFTSMDVVKELGLRWSSMSKQQKKKYVDISEQDQKRYQKEKLEYQTKLKPAPELELHNSNPPSPNSTIIVGSSIIEDEEPEMTSSQREKIDFMLKLNLVPKLKYADTITTSSSSNSTIDDE